MVLLQKKVFAKLVRLFTKTLAKYSLTTLRPTINVLTNVLVVTFYKKMVLFVIQNAAVKHTKKLKLAMINIMFAWQKMSNAPIYLRQLVHQIIINIALIHVINQNIFIIKNVVKIAHPKLLRKYRQQEILAKLENNVMQMVVMSTPNHNLV